MQRAETEEMVYPSGPKTAVIMSCLYISIFLVALDRTILATAIPTITNDFNSIDVSIINFHSVSIHANIEIGYRMVWQFVSLA